ncbi:MAG: hypothetical protein QOI13_2125 [Paraburkholderia sp.]|nr:hypothetical protein [Paraburkholderia sp.]
MELLLDAQRRRAINKQSADLKAQFKRLVHRARLTDAADLSHLGTLTDVDVKWPAIAADLVPGPAAPSSRLPPPDGMAFSK